MRKSFAFYFGLVTFFFTASFSNLGAATAEDYYKAGVDLYNQKQYAKAVEYLKTAVQQDPNDWKAYQTLGLAYYQTNQIPDALAAFDKSLALHDNPDLKKFADSLRKPSASPQSDTSSASSTPVTESTVGSPDAETALANFKKGRKLQEEARETLKSLGENQALTQEEKNIAKYGAIHLSRESRKFDVAFQLGSPTIGSLDFGIAFDPTFNLGLSVSYLPLSSGGYYYPESETYYAFEPRIKFYSNPNDLSFFTGFGVLIGGISYSYPSYPSDNYSSGWIGPNFKLGFSVVDDAGLFFELDWSIGVLIVSTQSTESIATYNYSTGTYTYRYVPYTYSQVVPAAIPGLRIGFAI